MKITLAKNNSFCDGVARAYEMVETLATKKNQPKKLKIYGSLVHNESVTKTVKQWGVKKIKTLRSVCPDDTVIITAHGTAKKVFDDIAQKGAQAFDATCPKVIKVQRLAKYHYEKGFQVIIFGDKDHTEVKGINGWCNNAGFIINSLEEGEKAAKELLQKGTTKAVFLSQTTQNIQLFKEVSKLLKKKLKSITIIDTICRATHNRQQEVKKMAQRHDAILVIGGKESGNTKRLWEVSKAINPQTFWISELDSATRKLLDKKAAKWKAVGIISGASTPTWEIEAMVQYLKEVSA